MYITPKFTDGSRIQAVNVYVLLTASQHINSSVAGSSTSVQSFVRKAGTEDIVNVFSPLLVYITDILSTFLEIE